MMDNNSETLPVYISSRKEKFIYLIDIVGTCNLRCVSCPVGNYTKEEYAETGRTRGIMGIDKFRKILDKIKSDDVAENVVIGLYNWGEPALHPDLVQMLTMIKEYGFNANLSSNFSLPDLDIRKIVAAEPGFLRISVSGYTQEVYSQTHQQGSIQMVISNLYRLRHFMDKLNKSFYVEIYYHLYRHNVGADLENMQRLATELKFTFNVDFAYSMLFHKTLKYLDGEQLSEKDNELLDLLLISPKERMELALPYKQYDCHIRSDIISIDYDGSVPLCCATYETTGYTMAPDFTQISHDDLQSKRYQHELCKECMNKAQHVAAMHEPRDKIFKLGNQRIQEERMKR